MTAEGDMAGVTDERLAAMRARCDAAMLGPWTWSRKAPDHNPDIWSSTGICVAIVWGYMCPAENAAFLAHARADLPDCLDEIARLRAELASTRDAFRAVGYGDPADPDPVVPYQRP